MQTLDWWRWKWGTFRDLKELTFKLNAILHLLILQVDDYSLTGAEDDLEAVYVLNTKLDHCFRLADLYASADCSP